MPGILGQYPSPVPTYTAYDPGIAPYNPSAGGIFDYAPKPKKPTRKPTARKGVAPLSYAGLLGTLQSYLQTPAQQRAQALADVRAQINEGLVALRSDRDDMLRQQLAQSNRAQGFASAIANMTAADPSTIKGYYSDAAGRIGAYGTGLTGAVAAAQQGNVDAAQAASSGATGGLGHVESYDVGGLRNIAQLTGVTQPATTLEEEAANAATAAVFGRQAQAGQIENIAQEYLGKMDETRRSYMSDAAKLQATRGKLFQDAIEAARTGNTNVMNSLIQARYLGASIGQMTGIDPLTGKPTYQATNDAANRAADVAHDKAVNQGKTEDEARADAKAAAARHAAAVKERSDAWAAAPDAMDRTIGSMIKTVKVKTPGKFGASGGTTTKTVKPTYAQARKKLEVLYQGLLRYADASGRTALKQKLDAMIDQVLAANGITPKAAPDVPGAATGGGGPVWVPPGGWTPGIGSAGTMTGGYVR